MRPSRINIFLTIFLLLGAGPAHAQDDSQSVPIKSLYTNAGLLRIALTNLGYFGHAWTYQGVPSGEYPPNSKTEHIYKGGLWVGARDIDGNFYVSTGSQDANGLIEGDNTREFVDYHLVKQTVAGTDTIVSYVEWSNINNDPRYHPDALASQHIEFAFRDNADPESGTHNPLGLKVILRVLAWDPSHADDFVIFDYAIINNNIETKRELQDLYVGLWVDTTVGNLDVTSPYDDRLPPWNFNDDMNGAWGPVGSVDDAYTVPGDPDIWMTYEHDDDGEEGLAPSWIGTRLLGSNMEAKPDSVLGVNPVSYNAWRFRGVPEQDDWYTDPADTNTPLPGKYQIMSNGAFTVGETQDLDYSKASNWIGLLSTGPFPSLAAGDTLRMTFAMVAGEDSVKILENSKIAQVAYNNGFSIPAGPPSPKLDLSLWDNEITLSWAPGDSVDQNNNPLPLDSPLRSPEHHISDITGREDFQGYRVYRYLGESIPGEPIEFADLIAQFDIIDGIGFDTGLPPLNEDGEREFVDPDLLDGFPYWYSVTSFSAPSVRDGLELMESGFYSNGLLIYPGPAPASDDNPRGVGVYPNPYRAGSMFDNRRGGEKGRKIWFTGLPERCQIQIYTLVGELVQTLYHDDPTSGQEPWDLLSGYTRTIASGLYIYVVENQDTGEIQRGKLVIIK